MAVGGAEGGDIPEGGRIGGQENDLRLHRKASQGLIEAQDRQRAAQAAGVNGDGLQCVWAGLRHEARTVVCGAMRAEAKKHV